jgi:hypothetical protein
MEKISVHGRHRIGERGHSRVELEPLDLFASSGWPGSSRFRFLAE